MRTSNGSKIAALAVALSLFAVACGDDKNSTSTTAAPETSAATTAAMEVATLKR